MTPKEQKEFNDFGCASRSILKYLELSKSPKTPDDFTTRFGKYFPKDQCGLLSLDKFCLVVTELGICNEVYSVRNRKCAKKALLNGQPTFALTDLDLDEHDNIKGDIFHVRLCLNAKDSATDPEDVSEIALFCPYQDGTEESLWFPIERLEKELVHFLVLA